MVTFCHKFATSLWTNFNATPDILLNFSVFHQFHILLFFILFRLEHFGYIIARKMVLEKKIDEPSDR